jgi:peptidase M28-like protein
MTRRRALSAIVLVLTLGFASIQAAGGRASITPGDLKEWLTFLSSDELEGRAVFTEGLGIAAGYIQGYLQAWGVKPGGEHGGYLQMVRVRSVKATNRSSLTVRVGSETRTFKDGDGITFPRNVGEKRTVTIDRVEFTGYGLDVPGHTDLRGKNVEGAAVVFLGPNGPKDLNQQSFRRVVTGRSRHAIDQLRAAATLGPSNATTPQGRGAPPAGGRGAAAGQGGGRGIVADFTTAQRLDLPIPPAVTAGDAVFEFLFSKAPVHYDELKRKATDGDPLPSFRLDGVTMTFDIDADYDVVRTQLTENVIGIVEGSDPQLKSTYVVIGAHYDHVGYADQELTQDGRRPSPPGRVTPGTAEDRIWNGADDDGSGTVAVMALARAFAQGVHPRRSIVFIWHAGEERGLYGSRYFADYPTVAIDKIVAQLNIDMIGRNRDDKKSEANTVYLVGSDRISSELDQISRAANRSLQPPLKLDYEMNDPSDPEQVYYRSDHYSYASKGIPIIFFTTGLHPDYHANTDEVSKIEFPKMTRITQLVYETALHVANLEHPPVRDNKGPRAGKGTP